jgi:hypothetical protein
MPDFALFNGKLRESALFCTNAFNEKGGRMDIGNALFELPAIAHWMPPKEQEQEKEKNKKIDYAALLIHLPDLNKPGEWSQRYKDKLDAAAYEPKKYGELAETLKMLEKQSEKNRYHWELYSAINDFQVTAPHLLLR